MGRVNRVNVIMSKWFCEQCGKENDGDFCTECGHSKPQMAEKTPINDEKELGTTSEKKLDDVSDNKVESPKSKYSIMPIALIVGIVFLGFNFVDEQFLTNVKSIIAPETETSANIVSEDSNTKEVITPKKRASTE